MSKELGKKLQEYKQSLIDTALEHERVIRAKQHIEALLKELGREDVTSETSVLLGKEGIAVTIRLIYRTLYPGEIAADRNLAREMEQKEVALADALPTIGLKILRGSIIINGQTHLCVFRANIDYEGNLVEDDQ